MPRHQKDAIVASLLAQVGKHANTAIDYAEASLSFASVFAGSEAVPLLDFMLCPSIPGYPITAKVRSLSTWPGEQVEKTRFEVHASQAPAETKESTVQGESVWPSLCPKQTKDSSDIAIAVGLSSTGW